jgi:hypothetical protein
MAIKLFDVRDGRAIASDFCYTIDIYKQIMAEYKEDFPAIFAYYQFMCELDEENNPFANVPESDKEEVILKEVSGNFSPDEDLVYKGLEFTKKLFETPTHSTYLTMKVALEKIGKYIRSTPITDGRDGNFMDIIRAAEKYDSVCRSFNERYKAFKEENSVRNRGGGYQSYDM